jgi:predicted glycosyltransferase
LKTKKVLIAPLNWGLGHATRCIPVINAFRKAGCEVVLASDGSPLNLLKKEFPHLKALELPSYNVRYSKHLPMALSIGLQMPKVLMNIRKERLYLNDLQKTEHFDIVASDCRFGCFIPGIKNVYLTHQVLIRFPKWCRVLEKPAAFFHKLVWQKFDRVWVIDRQGDLALSGEMGHSYTHPKLAYIGILSRFASVANTEKTTDVCFLLSGPEPHRTLWEKAIVSCAWPERKKYRLIRGLPETNERLPMPGNWTVSNHLSSDELQTALLSSKHIVCRSGYSTIMDLARLGLHATLIPTPGQSEQEYLAEYMSRKFGFASLDQRSMSTDALELDKELPLFVRYEEKEDENLLSKAIREVLEK